MEQGVDVAPRGELRGCAPLAAGLSRGEVDRARSAAHPCPARTYHAGARETATLDRLSGGRLTLGVGQGSDRYGGEYSITGEEVDDKRRALMLDEALRILTAAWSGEPVHHHGEHYTVDGMPFLPRPVQRRGIPVWVGGYHGRRAPMRRAARYQGFVAAGLEHPDQLAEIVADLAALRRTDSTTDPQPYDIVVALDPGCDPAPYAEAGATWCLVGVAADAARADLVRAIIRDGPMASA